MTRVELDQAAAMLRLASDRFSNDGCTEVFLENTNENWAMIQSAEEWNGTPAEDRRERPPAEQKLCTDNWFLMGYLAACIECEESDEDREDESGDEEE